MFSVQAAPLEEFDCSGYWRLPRGYSKFLSLSWVIDVVIAVGPVPRETSGKGNDVCGVLRSTSTNGADLTSAIRANTLGLSLIRIRNERGGPDHLVDLFSIGQIESRSLGREPVLPFEFEQEWK